MFNLSKFAEVVLPQDPANDTRKLTDAIEKLNEHVAKLQQDIDDVKPKEPDDGGQNPPEEKPDDGTAPKEE